MSRSTGWWLLSVAGIAVGFALACDGFVRSKSVTYDETIYAALGQLSAQQAALDPEIPRLGIAPIPVVTSHVIANWGRRDDRISLFVGQAGDAAAVRTARRIHWVLFGLPLLVFVMAWVYRRRGWFWSVVAGLLLTASPTMLAHASLATTDLAFALTGLLAVASWIRCDKHPSFNTFVLAATVTGLAAACKYSVIMILPVAAVISVRCPSYAGMAGWKALLVASGMIVAMMLMVLLTSWVLHGFAMVQLSAPARMQLCPGDSFLNRWLDRPLPGPVVGWLSQLAHNVRGHEAFALGQHRVRGWWWYFPLAIGIKSTVVECLLIAAILLPGGRREQRQPAPGAPSPWWFWFIVTVMIVAMLARLNIGHRYLLILYPLLVMLGVDRIADARLQKWHAAAVAVVLVALQWSAALSIAPHYLSYFSPIVGGAAQGHSYLGDSNLDWGQDLPALRRWLDDHPDQRCLLAYFGTADAHEYGVDCPDASAENLTNDSYRYLAVSVTLLQGLYLDNTFRDRFGIDAHQGRQLLQLEPVARAGNSIWMFDLTDPDVRKILPANR